MRRAVLRPGGAGERSGLAAGQGLFYNVVRQWENRSRVVFDSRMLIESFLAVLALTIVLVVVLAGVAKLLFGE